MTPAPQVPEALAEAATRAAIKHGELCRAGESPMVSIGEYVLTAALPEIHKQRDQEIREKLERVAANSEEQGRRAGAGEEARLRYAEAAAIREAADTVLSPSPPCERCGGTKVVSQRFGSGSKTALMPCPDCGTGEKQPEPDPEPFADIAPLTATWGNGGQLQALTVKTPEGIVRLVPEQPEPGEGERDPLDVIRLLIAGGVEDSQLPDPECTDLFDRGLLKLVAVGNTGEYEAALTPNGYRFINAFVLGIEYRPEPNQGGGDDGE